MLLLEDIAAWLKTAPRSVVTPISYNVQPDKPNAVITIADTGGFGLEVEDAMDNPTFQVRCRGPGNDPITPRDLAFQLDGLFLAERSFFIGGAYVLKIGRVGGRPSYLGIDEHQRTTYTGNYTITSER